MPITLNAVVRFKDKEGWYRVKSLWKKGTEANLSGVFDGTIHHKRVPVDQLMEDYQNWSDHWSKSETYKSM